MTLRLKYLTLLWQGNLWKVKLVGATFHLLRLGLRNSSRNWHRRSQKWYLQRLVKVTACLSMLTVFSLRQKHACQTSSCLLASIKGVSLDLFQTLSYANFKMLVWKSQSWHLGKRRLGLVTTVINSHIQHRPSIQTGRFRLVFMLLFLDLISLWLGWGF